MKEYMIHVQGRNVNGSLVDFVLTPPAVITLSIIDSETNKGCGEKTIDLTKDTILRRIAKEKGRMNIQPARDLALIKPDDPKDHYGVLIIPEAYREAQSIGTVLAVGPGGNIYEPEFDWRTKTSPKKRKNVRMLFKPGMRVMFPTGGVIPPRYVTIADEELVFISARGIHGEVGVSGDGARHTFEPAYDRLLVQLLPAESFTESGIIIPEKSREPSRVGFVVALGYETIDGGPSKVQHEFRNGDKVVINPRAGFKIGLDNREYWLIDRDEVLAVKKGGEDE